MPYDDERSASTHCEPTEWSSDTPDDDWVMPVVERHGARRNVPVAYFGDLDTTDLKCLRTMIDDGLEGTLTQRLERLGVSRATFYRRTRRPGFQKVVADEGRKVAQTRIGNVIRALATAASNPDFRAALDRMTFFQLAGLTGPDRLEPLSEDL